MQNVVRIRREPEGMTESSAQAAPAGGPVITARDLVFRYPSANGGDPTIDGLTLDFARGAITVIVGASGCGKTTLLNLIGGLLRPSDGELLVDGGVPAAQHAKMGYMPARDGLLPWRNAIANVTLPLEGGRSDLTAKGRKERARELLERVGLGRYVDYFPDQLSHGMRQRVSLARALVSDPQILLMDEPFGALDPVTRAALQTELARIHKAFDKTIVLVTHDIDEALGLATRIVLLDHGRIVQSGTPLEMLSNPVNAFVTNFFGRSDVGIKLLGLQSVASRLRLNERAAGEPVLASMSLREVLSVFVERRVARLPVVDENGQALGVIDFDDLLDRRR